MRPMTDDPVGARRDTVNMNSESKHPVPDFDPALPVGRDRIAEEIVETVGPGARGVLLAGEPGMGKTFLLERVRRMLTRDMHLVQVRGSSIGARTENGALRFLLDAADGEEPQHPVFVYQRLAQLLQNRSEGRPVVLLVDNAHLLDALAAVVIGLLARSGQARLVVACNGISTLSADLVGLWKDGLLDLHEIRPFTPDETGVWIAAALNANVSPLAARAFWDHSGGNPLILRTLIQEQLQAGTLVNRGGTYVLAAAVVLDGRPLADAVGARLSKLSANERSVLELLALSEGLSPDMLRGITASKDVDFLIGQGLAGRTAGRAVIRVKYPAVAEIIRREVPPGRSTQLQKQLDSSLRRWVKTPVRVKPYAAWKLACGSTLEPELALGAAEAANRSGDFESALRFLGVLADRHTNHKAVLNEAWALRQLNRPDEADEILDTFSQGALETLHLASAADFILERASLACTQKHAPFEAGTHLQELRSRLGRAGSAPHVAPGIVRNLKDRLTLAEAALSTYQGDYTDTVTALTSLDMHRGGWSDELRLRAGGLLSEALAMTGRQDDALRVAEEVTERMNVSELPDRSHAELRKCLMLVYLTAGMWDKCAEAISYIPRFRGTSGLWLRELDLVGTGLIHAYAGRASQALDALEPTIVQLRCLRSEGALQVALAAAAYSHALLGNLPASRNCLRELKALPLKNAWIIRGAVEYFSALAAAVASPGPETITELLRHADNDQLAGRVSHELFFLNAAVRLGELAAAPRLLAVARRCQGALAEASKVLATGLMAGNPELLLAAGELANDFGNECFCRDAAVAAHEVAVRTNNRTAARRALHVATASERKMNGQSPHDTVAARLDCLTVREREIVKLAGSGASNREIAQQLHVSVRTVEGHLYQVYTKLQISSRDSLHRVHQEATRTGSDG